MKNVKKLICILITAALAVCFAFTLVACNNAKPVDMTDADFDSLAAFSDDTLNPESRSYRVVITTVTETQDGTVTEEKTISVYTNGTNDRTVTIDTVLTKADGSVTTTYYLAGSDGGRKVEAEARYENGASTPSYSNYNRNASIVMSDVINNSGALAADQTIKNVRNFEIISAKVTKHSDSDLDYEISYSTDDSGTANASISVNVDGGVISSATLKSGNVTTTYVFTLDLGEKEPGNQKAWYDKHPETEAN